MSSSDVVGTALGCMVAVCWVALLLAWSRDRMGALPRGLRWIEQVWRAYVAGARWVLLRVFYPERLPQRQRQKQVRQGYPEPPESVKENMRRQGALWDPERRMFMYRPGPAGQKAELERLDKQFRYAEMQDSPEFPEWDDVKRAWV